MSKALAVCRMACFAWRRVYGFDPITVLLTTGLLLYGSVQSYATLYLSKQILDSLSSSGSVSYVAPIVALAGLQIAGAVLGAWSAERSSRLQLSYSNHCDLDIIHQTSKRSLLEKEHPSYHSSLAYDRFISGKSYELYTQTGQLVSKLVIAALCCRYLAGASLSILLLALTIGGLRGGLQLLTVRRRVGLGRDIQRQSVQHLYYYDLLTSSPSQKELTLYGTVPYFTKKWLTLKREVDRLQLRMERLLTRSYSAGEGLSILNYAAVSLFAAWGVASGKLTLGDFAAMTMAMTLAVSNLTSIVQSWAGMLEIHGHLANGSQSAVDTQLPASSQPGCPSSPSQGTKIWPEYSLITEGQGLSDESQQGHQGIKRDRLTYELGADRLPFAYKRELRIDRLTFRYPNRVKDALSEVSLTIRKGEKIAILGENGSGKSTLIKAVLGLYDTDNLSITYDGIPLPLLDRSSLYSRMHAVFQDFVRYQSTFRENIAVGEIEDVHNDKKLTSILTRMNLAGAATEGLDTHLGQLEDRSVNLSGGEWQRLALARLCLKPEVDLVVLDEPTSAIDPLSEIRILEELLEQFEEQTVLLVSHRVGIARKADRIVVMSGGRAVECGSHDELLIHEGLYSRMWKEQKSWYEC